ncbi:MAG TPA: signal recognition particle-docking protein FtsY, partial [Thermoplasmata archaeon]|nr:signal recognition particle-docking protein FtsY [Thermoplasmata archaeon]
MGAPPAPSDDPPKKPAQPAAESGASEAASAFHEGFLARPIDPARLADILDELEVVLLQSDVALPVIERIRRDLKRELAGKKVRWGADLEAAVRTSLEASVRAILSQPEFDLMGRIRAQAVKPYIVLFLGVNGTGKTTTVAKIAGKLRDAGCSVVIAAGDTFRAGAIEQLLVHGERLGIRVVRQQEGSDPAAVAFDAVQHAKAKGVDVVLIDTAGRQHTNENLIEEAKKIRRVVRPDCTLFVGDALSGNDVVQQAKLFQEALGLDGIVLTKLDADTKGGAALSLTFVTKRPIVYVGTGQGYADLGPFEADRMVERL